MSRISQEPVLLNRITIPTNKGKEWRTKQPGNQPLQLRFLPARTKQMSCSNVTLAGKSGQRKLLVKNVNGGFYCRGPRKVKPDSTRQVYLNYLNLNPKPKFFGKYLRSLQA
jgi:hypothetical protein